MKKIKLIIALVFLSVAGYAQKGHSSMGASVGYALDVESVTFGVDYRYNPSSNVRLAPSLTHMFRNNGVSAWYIALDAHYLVRVSRNFSFYPIGGLDLSVWSFKGYRENINRLGLNVGLGGEVYATSEISVGLDMKYNLIKDFDQALAAVRVAYHF